jgi:putative Mg2+ transporter-C (MgtC) family protein
MGINRSLAGKHAGMRTFALVSLGSCVFTVISTLSSFELSSFAAVNPLQIAGSVVIGIGFIGTGLAAFRGEQVELTTASGVWVVAGIGMACGFGFYIIATAATVLSLVVFSGLSHVEHWMQVRFGGNRSV